MTERSDITEESETILTSSKDGDEGVAGAFVETEIDNGISGSLEKPESEAGIVETLSDTESDTGGLTEKQILARARMHEQIAILIEKDREKKRQKEKESAESADVERNKSGARKKGKVPDVVYDPEDAPPGPPWRYEPTPEQLAEKHERKERKARRKERVKNAALEKTPKKLKNPSNLQVRFRTALIYTLLTIACVFAGEIPTLIYLMIVAGICAGEFYFMLRSDAKLPNEALGITAAVLYLPAVYFWRMTGALIVTVLLLLALLVWYVFWLKSRISDVGVSFFGAAYTGLLLCGILIIRQSVDGLLGGLFMFLLFLSVWANDAFAYFVGSRIGKHKLAPRTSPNKSWEGFIAGLVGSAICWVLMSLIPVVNMHWGTAIFIGVVCGLTEVLGDLVESRIKRNSGFKDSGTIMPGHGGLLDRCDSLFLASITAVILLIAFGCIDYPIF